MSRLCSLISLLLLIPLAFASPAFLTKIKPRLWCDRGRDPPDECKAIFLECQGTTEVTWRPGSTVPEICDNCECVGTRAEFEQALRTDWKFEDNAERLPTGGWKSDFTFTHSAIQPDQSLIQQITDSIGKLRRYELGKAKNIQVVAQGKKGCKITFQAETTKESRPTNVEKYNNNYALVVKGAIKSAVKIYNINAHNLASNSGTSNPGASNSKTSVSSTAP